MKVMPMRKGSLHMRPLLILLLLLCLGCGVKRPDNGPPPDHKLTVLVQPLGPIPAAQLDSVRVGLVLVHGAEVRIAGQVELPASAYTTLRSPRYRADTLIAWLREVKPDSVDLILGITAQDISITKYGADGAIKEPTWKYRDFGIFGLGYIGGPSCVVSTFRLGDGRGPVFFDRLLKVTVHEIGHNRRLPHCLDPGCVMRDAVEHLSSVDAAGRGMCAVCRQRANRY